MRADTAFSHFDLLGSDVGMVESISETSSPNSRSSPSHKLDISCQNVSFRLSVPNSLHTTAISLRDEFVETVDQAPSTTISLLSNFILFLLKKIEISASDLRSTDNYDRLLALSFGAFEHDFLQESEVHTVVAELDVPSNERTAIISAYFQAQCMLGRWSEQVPSALCQAAHIRKAVVYAMFGGQGNDTKYFEDIREVYTTYRPILNDFVCKASTHLQRLADDMRFHAHYPQGLNVEAWLKDEELQPDNESLIAAPLSFPLIGLLQILHFKVTCHILGYTPEQMHKTLAGVTGHSQGIIIATLVAAATSWESFDKLGLECLSILQSIGARSQEKFAIATLDSGLERDAEEHGEGVLSPMLSVQNLPVEDVYKLVAKTNKHLPKGQKVEVALINSSTKTVVAGPPLSLYGLNLLLRELKPASERQSKIPFSQRKPNIAHRFLPITAPFHSSYLSEVAAAVYEDVKSIRILGNDLHIPVFSTEDGTDLRHRGSSDIVHEIISMITEVKLSWPSATSWDDATHVINFGPGGISGVKPAVKRNKYGTSVRTIIATRNDGTSRAVGYKSEIFNRNPQRLLYGENWGQKYTPRLSKNPAGQTIVDTKFSRLLGLPPIMVGGMTPTTVSWEFVAATMNAGYHIELALGGYHNAVGLTTAIENIVKNVAPGRGITCNIIYAAPHAVQWQIPLLTKLRAQGVPIHGLTIGAGVPSTEIVTGYINTMGLKHIGLKPGSIEAIHQVIKIARENPAFPIVMQWTGGRGGGHHSYEDFHQPILQTYDLIRGCPNIILVAGSGFGGYEDSYPYLSGTWSEKYQEMLMPFDGILLGSRVLVAKEAKTSLAAKKAIVNTPGVDDSRWEETYKSDAGGIRTVISEMGEPIHKLATRGVNLWSELDNTVFKLEKSKRVAWLRENKSYLIRRLNDDFAKPWFGRNSLGEAVDLEGMTYSEVAFRLISLMYVRREGRWVDSSWQKLLYDFLLFTESRSLSNRPSPSYLKDASDLSDPELKVQGFFSTYHSVAMQRMGYQDALYFLMICKRSGQKPVPFIPVFDQDFETFFKKDSLWQSEDIAAVVDEDVGRVCVLQGPVAVQWSKIVNEPIQQILGNINDSYKESLSAVTYNHEVNSIPDIDYFGNVYEDICPIPNGVTVSEHEDTTIYQIQADASVNLFQWIRLLGGPKNDWRRAFFNNATILQDRVVADNPVRRIFKPLPNSCVLIQNAENPEKTTISLVENCLMDSSEPTKVVEVRAEQGNVVVMELFGHRNALGKPTSLVLRYNYHPATTFAPIHESMLDREERVNDFYHRVWFGQELHKVAVQSSKEVFDGGSFTVESDTIAEFARCIVNQDDAFSKRFGKELSAPLDFIVVIAWKALMRPLFSHGVHGDLLKLVHLSNEFGMVSGACEIREGDKLSSESYITAIINQDAGKMVEVQGHILRDGEKIVDLTSRFLYRGIFKDFENTFSRVKEPEMEIYLESPTDVAILQSKSWFHLHDPSIDLLGQKLIFSLRSAYKFEDKDVFSSLETTGNARLKGSGSRKDVPAIASIKFQSGRSTSNPVIAYLKRHKSPFESRRMFSSPIQAAENSAVVIEMPQSNEEYASISGDLNPIHVSQALSRYLDLPGTITHGMYTSARVRGIVEHILCPSRTSLFRSWKCSFTSMVLPGDKVEVKFSHIGMIAGRKIIKVTAANTDTHAIVLEGEAEIEPEDTAYVFTGQGSQFKGMGMDLYAKSEAARRVWDSADKYYHENYGKAHRSHPKSLI